MKQQGKFILLTLSEFIQWLSKKTISRSIKLIQNHHTWMPDYHSFTGNNHFKLLVAMEVAHRQRKFQAIAQNLTTFPDGLIAVCRDLDMPPAGIKGANEFGICIEHVGNFDAGHDQMTAAHRETIIGVNAALCERFELIPSTETVVYHHWYDLDTGRRTNGTGNVKTCPGTAFFGGNTVKAAAVQFIPSVTAELNKMKGVA